MGKQGDMPLFFGGYPHIDANIPFPFCLFCLPAQEPIQSLPLFFFAVFHFHSPLVFDVGCKKCGAKRRGYRGGTAPIVRKGRKETGLPAIHGGNTVRQYLSYAR